MALNLLIELDYSCNKNLQEMSQQMRDELRKKVFALNELKDPKEGEAYYSTGIYGKILVTEEEFEYLNSLGLEVNIKNFKNTYPVELPPKSGKQYHFHLPNLGLLHIRQVSWLEDSCTEELQKKLDEGWLILAVCPPNGQRRPDYILGRGE